VKSSPPMTVPFFRLELGQSVEFDWTWEGATAFRPINFDKFSMLANEPDENQEGLWSGELVEVDEAKGTIYVWIDDPEKPPKKGLFYVRPFEFLACLHSIYCDPTKGELRPLLPGRLHASRGKCPPSSRSFFQSMSSSTRKDVVAFMVRPLGAVGHR